MTRDTDMLPQQEQYLDRAIRNGTAIEEVNGMLSAGALVAEARGKAGANSLTRARVHVLIERFRQHAKDISPDRDPYNDEIESVEDMEADTWVAAANELALEFGFETDEAHQAYQQLLKERGYPTTEEV